jgi:hypothetical protein
VAYELLPEAEVVLSHRKEHTMSLREQSESISSNPNRDVDPQTIDLGDDPQRTLGNQDSSLQDQHTGLEGGIDPGTTDLGDDVRRST